MSEVTVANSIWRVIAIGLITLITGSIGTWAMVGKDKVSREEVREMIKTEAPSAAQLDVLNDKIVGLQIELARTTEKLDLVLKKLDRQ